MSRTFSLLLLLVRLQLLARRVQCPPKQSRAQRGRRVLHAGDAAQLQRLQLGPTQRPVYVPTNTFAGAAETSTHRLFLARAATRAGPRAALVTRPAARVGLAATSTSFLQREELGKLALAILQRVLVEEGSLFVQLLVPVEVI